MMNLLEACKETSSISDLKPRSFKEITSSIMKRLKGQMKISFLFGSAKDERLIKEMNEKGIDSSKNESVKEEGPRRRKIYFICLNLMREQYSEFTLDGFALILWGDLKIMMESSTEGNETKGLSGVATRLEDCHMRCMI
ncbi:hypothetical protein Tco_0257049 [Tanacetum coccineum]